MPSLLVYFQLEAEVCTCHCEPLDQSREGDAVLCTQPGFVQGDFG